MIKTFEQYNEMDPYGEEEWDEGTTIHNYSEILKELDVADYKELRMDGKLYGFKFNLPDHKYPYIPRIFNVVDNDGEIYIWINSDVSNKQKLRTDVSDRSSILRSLIGSMVELYRIEKTLEQYIIKDMEDPMVNRKEVAKILNDTLSGKYVEFYTTLGRKRKMIKRVNPGGFFSKDFDYTFVDISGKYYVVDKERPIRIIPEPIRKYSDADPYGEEDWDDEIVYEQYNEMDPYGEEDWNEEHYNVGDLLICKKNQYNHRGHLKIIDGETYCIRDVILPGHFSPEYYVIYFPKSLLTVSVIAKDKMKEYFDKIE